LPEVEEKAARERRIAEIIDNPAVDQLAANLEKTLLLSVLEV
jgi:hypothetical protein